MQYKMSLNKVREQRNKRQHRRKQITILGGGFRIE
jgi:hypothetical protein